MTRLQVTPITGRVETATWSDACVLPLTTGQELVCSYSLTGISAAAEGRKVFNQLQAARYYTPEQFFTYLTALQETLQTDTFSCAVVVVAEKKYICATYNASVSVHRGKQWKSILKTEAQWNMVIGAVQDSDVLLLATVAAAPYLQSQLQSFGEFSVALSATRLAPSIQAAEHSGTSALCYVEHIQNKRFESKKILQLTSKITALWPQLLQARWKRLSMIGIVGICVVAALWFSWKWFFAQSPTVTVTPVQTEAAQKSEESIVPNLQPLPVFYDLRLAVPDFVATAAIGTETYTLAIDGQKKTAVLLENETKKVVTATAELFGSVKAVSLLEDKGFVLLADGVWFIPFTATDLKPQLLKDSGESNKAATLIGTFGSYIYVFNPVKRALYRYAKQPSGYSDPISWLQTPLGVSYTSITALSIDGDVWLSTAEGGLKKGTSGTLETFPLTGVEPPVASAVFVSTTEQASSLAVLEPAAKRVLIFSKSGGFIRQITSPSLAAAQSIFMNEAGTQVFVLNGSLIYTISL